MELKVLQVCSKTPISLTEVKSFLRLETNAEDELLRRLIKTACTIIENETGSTLLQESFRVKLSPEHRLGHKKTTAGVVYEEKGGRCQVRIKKGPFFCLTGEPQLSFTEGSGKEVRKNLKGYTPISSFHEGWLVLRGPLPQNATLTFDFTCGYGENALDVPDTLRHAIQMLVADLYENREPITGNASRISALSGTLRSILQPYRIRGGGLL